MAIQTVPDVCPDFGFTKNVRPRVLIAEFGDGYRERAADGINTLPESFSLKWTNIVTADATLLEDFFKARAGVEAFKWTPPDEGSEKVYTCPRWSKSPTAFGFYNMTAEYQQEFDIGV